MSVQTASDEMLVRIRERLKDIHRDLTEILFGDVWGADEYNEEFVGRLEECMTKIIQARKLLRG